MALKKKPVNGMRDILPEEAYLRDYVTNVIKETYRSFGFTPIETPLLEEIGNLSNDQGGENEKLIFKVLKIIWVIWTSKLQELEKELLLYKWILKLKE
jgi:histidyl-tRNA synthetase